MTPNLCVCAICFRPEVVYDVISVRNVKTIEGNLAVNFEVASSNSFRDMLKKSFHDGGGGRFRVSLKNLFSHSLVECIEREKIEFCRELLAAV